MNVVSSAERKVGQICSAVGRRIDTPGQHYKRGCSVKHGKQFVACAQTVVYRLPLACGKVYVGQTGRCLNIRLREHHSSLLGRPYTHLALHCKECQVEGCKPLFEKTTVMYRPRGRTQREIVEAYQISREGPLCVSHPSVSLQDAELAFLERSVR